MHHSNGSRADTGLSNYPWDPPPTQNTDSRPVTFGNGLENIFKFSVTQMNEAANPRRNPFTVEEMDLSEDGMGGNTSGEVSY